MDEQRWLAEGFEEHRPHLRAVAYRMLGSLSEADDAVQEAWLRLSRTDADGIENLGGWLTTVVARVCLDMLRARSRAARSRSTSTCPTRSSSRADGADPEHEALLADSVGLALLVVLETLGPPSGSRSCCTTCSRCRSTRSRPIVGRSPTAARQLASRARRRVQGAAAGSRRRPRPPARGRRRVLRRRARRGLRRAGRGARPRRRAARRRRRRRPTHSVLVHGAEAVAARR